MLIRIITAAVFITAMALTIVAQQPATQFEVIKIAVIDLEAFSEEKTGIARLTNARAALGREFKSSSDELQNMRTRFEAVTKEIEALAKTNPADPRPLQRKIDERSELERDMKRKTGEGNLLFERRQEEVLGPIWEDVNKALRAFAAQRGISVILEKSRLASNNLAFIVDEKGDITRTFISEYNQRNPATSVAPATARP